MTTSRRLQPRRRRPLGLSPQPRQPNQPGRAGRPALVSQYRRAPQPAQHHHVIIDATNATYWLAHIRESASRACLHSGPEAGEGLDQIADDLAACMAAGWIDGEGRPVLQWQYHMWVAPQPDGLHETIVEFWPEHLAA